VFFLSRHWQPGAMGALRMGFRHGGYCVGCCWFLMALLFVVGVMNLAGSRRSRSMSGWRRWSRAVDGSVAPSARA